VLPGVCRRQSLPTAYNALGIRPECKRLGKPSDCRATADLTPIGAAIAGPPACPVRNQPPRLTLSARSRTILHRTRWRHVQQAAYRDWASQD